MADLSSCIVAWYGYVWHFHHSNMFQTEIFCVLQVIFKFIFFVAKKKVFQSLTDALSSYVCFV